MTAMMWNYPAHAQEVPGCGDLHNHYGPFDYRDPVVRSTRLPIVEAFHFTSEVEALIAGHSSTLEGDLSYTLRACPNHHRALSAAARYGLRGGKFSNELIPTAECYMKRAIAFAPDDATVRVIYGNFLTKRRKLDLAKEQYDEALRLEPDSIEINYNAGLFYLDEGDLERAKELAKVAYDGGYPLPGLRDRIAEVEARRGR